MRHPRHRLWTCVALLLSAAALQACGDETPSGPELPIDGTWEMTGIFSDSVGFARCWLSGTMTLESVGGGVNTMVGDVSYSYDCNVFGDQEIFADSGAIERGRLTGENLSLALGRCSWGATYARSESGFMSGIGGCRIFPTALPSTDILGSWEGHRVTTETP
ncbi:MAG: hypothetical protein AAF389_09035 [Gemmatimonadota bacterium]